MGLGLGGFGCGGLGWLGFWGFWVWSLGFGDFELQGNRDSYGYECLVETGFASGLACVLCGLSFLFHFVVHLDVKGEAGLFICSTRQADAATHITQHNASTPTPHYTTSHHSKTHQQDKATTGTRQLTATADKTR